MNENLYNEIRIVRDAMREAKKEGRLHECWADHDAIMVLLDRGTEEGIANHDRQMLSLTMSLSRLVADCLVEALQAEELSLEQIDWTKPLESQDLFRMN